MSDVPAARRIIRLVGVYDADGTIRGELVYWIGARLGRSHCSLCDITHGLVRERPEWKSCRASLGVPFDTYHRDDQPANIRIATGNAVPAVLADTSEGVVSLLGPADIQSCDGSIETLIRAIHVAAASGHLAGLDE